MEKERFGFFAGERTAGVGVDILYWVRIPCSDAIKRYSCGCRNFTRDIFLYVGVDSLGDNLLMRGL
jgi:hypothetical protein